jgi:predicted deacylase
VAEPFVIGGQRVGRGERRTIDLPVARLYTHTQLSMPVHVARGRRDGPCLFVCAVIHGDELNGAEIIRRLLRHSALRRLRGTLIAVPVVNVHGLIHHSRYLPDRRDLNRSFPGSDRGSLAARLADLFMTEIVAHCQYGIDLHTGAVHRSNLPQIRAQLKDPETLALARAFGVPVLLDSDLRDGSLRQAAADEGVRILLYEGGEALRFDELSIRAGLVGILNILRALQMLPPTKRRKRARAEPVVARSSGWVRAPESGILRTAAPLGTRVAKDQNLGVIADPFGERVCAVSSPWTGIVIGRSTLPLANEGDALFHIARFKDAEGVEEQLSAFQDVYSTPGPLEPSSL